MQRPLVRLALLGATRKPARTLLTAGMILFGTALVILATSWIGGVWQEMVTATTRQMGDVRVVTTAFERRAALLPLYENIAEVGPVLTALEAVEGVTGAYPSIETPVMFSIGEEIGEHFALAIGADERWYRDRAELDSALIAGRWLERDEGELVLGRTLAERVGAKVGDEVLVLGQTQDGALSPVKGALVGIVDGGNALANQRIYLSLQAMRYLADMEGGALSVLVYGEDSDDAAALAASLRPLPALAGLHISAWNERSPMDGITAGMGLVRSVLTFVVVFLAALGVWNTMMMSVLERTAEVGVMRAMGLTRLGSVLLFVGEAVAIAILGGSAGVAVGAAVTLFLADRGVRIGDQITSQIGSDIPMIQELHPVLLPETLAQAFLLGLAIAVLGSLLPAIRAAAIQPHEAMQRK